MKFPNRKKPVPFTKQHRHNLSRVAKQKGFGKWMNGKKHSQETKDKMSKSHKGIRHSKEHRLKLSIALSGKKKSFEHNVKNSESHKGENSITWKGGITPENCLIRRSLQYRLWQKAVWERDNFTCQKYQTRGGNIVAHHINNFSEFPELRFAIDNGITLSEKAHQEFHKKYGFKNNTKEQLIEFIN